MEKRMNRRVSLLFEDKDSLTSSEIEANLKSAYGSNAQVTILPANPSPQAYISLGVSELITAEQANIFYDQNEQYETKLVELRHSVVKKLLFILNDVIMDNEEKFSS